jgi:ATP-dependent DNA helicase RecQ
MEEAGMVEREDGEIRLLTPREDVSERARELAGQFETLRTQDSRRLDSIAEYASTQHCRAVFLRSYFGEEGGRACGLCDVCRGQPARPAGFFAPLAQPEHARGKQRQRRTRGRRRRRPAARQPSGASPQARA